jgi:hypothetical protein
LNICFPSVLVPVPSSSHNTIYFQEDYVHRIGRTARGADKGTAITFFTREDDKHANQLCKCMFSIFHLSSNTFVLFKVQID